MTRVLIYGAGAIGSFVGYLLSEAGDRGRAVENVALLGRRGHLQKIKETGLKIALPGHELGGSRSLRFKHSFFSLKDLEASGFYPDVVVVSVKTYSLPGVCEELAASGLLEKNLKDAEFLLLMNGMGNREIFDQLDLPSSRVHEGINIIGVTFPADGRVELKGAGKTVFEDKVRQDTRAFLRERFEEMGFDLEFKENFKEQQWNKLFANSVINPITALTRRENGIVLSRSLEGLVKNIVDECVLVARTEGINAESEKVLETIISVAEKTSANTSSMLQDVLRGRRTEIDSINGYVIRLANKHGIRADVNEALFSLVKMLEGQGHDQGRQQGQGR
jgi:2-dehydropantoate 2-reductase